MATQSQVNHVFKQLLVAADEMDTLDIDGSSQVRTWADELAVGKLSPARAMRLLCRVSSDISQKKGA